MRFEEFVKDMLFYFLNNLTTFTDILIDTRNTPHAINELIIEASYGCALAQTTKNSIFFSV